jgi:pimeloyl-ACP methyl ester carboxylesterase
VKTPGGPPGVFVCPAWFTGVDHPEIAAQYDIIGFDPRGVGAPRQHCLAIRPGISADGGS